MADAKKASTDVRRDYVLKRVSHALQTTFDDKFKKQCEADESLMRTLMAFIEDSDGGFCYFYGGSGGPIQASSFEPPKPNTQLRRKCIVAYKASKGISVTDENYSDLILFQEITKNVMEVLDNVTDSVYSAPLSNPANQVGWSDLICNDTLDKFFSLRAQLQVTTGLMKGTTRLPLPPALPDKPPKDRVHVLESAVILWTKQIRYVLKQDNETPLKAGLNPDPLTEIKFWKHKASNLDSIYEQLEQEGVKTLLKVLESNKSTYTEPFAKLQKEVYDAREEARDNVTFLKTLEPLFNELIEETGDFLTIPELLPKIFHTLMLIWTYSKFYNTPPRLVVIVREMCNSLISRAQGFVSGQQVFSMLEEESGNEAIEKLDKTLAVCTSMKDIFGSYKAKAERLPVNEDGSLSPATNWKKVQSHALFSRLDTFRERVRDVYDFARTVVQFQKLEKIEIGGTKGGVLTDTIRKVHADFFTRLGAFKEVQGQLDLLDVADKGFDTRLFMFRADIKDLERKLAAVLTTAFDDSDTIGARLKLFESFEGMLERPIIQDELERKYSVLVEQFRTDLKNVQQMFLSNRSIVDSATDDCPLFANMPPVAGSIFWVRSLEQRVNEPLQKLHGFCQSMRGEGDIPEDLMEADRMTRSLISLLKEYEVQRVHKWENDSVIHIKDKLQNFLLRRADDNLIHVNFSPELICLLREVRYFRLLSIQVPPVAEELFEKAEIYRMNAEKFEEIAEKYNNVITELFPIEEPLLSDRIAHVDKTLKPGMDEMRWEEDDLSMFISTSFDGASTVANIVDTLKENLKNCSGIISNWANTPLVERKLKPMTPEDFESIYKDNFNKRQPVFVEEGKEIHRFIRNSADALRVSKNSQDWINYTEFVNDVVAEGITTVVNRSIVQMSSFLDPSQINKTDSPPIFETKLLLDDGQIKMEPSFDFNQDYNSVRDVISAIVKSFFTVGTVVQRLDTSGDFLCDLRENMELQCGLANVTRLVDNAEKQIEDFCASFNDFMFLWTTDVDAAFEEFLETDPKQLVPNFKDPVTEMSFDTIMETIQMNAGPPIPTLEVFESQIQRFESYAKMIAELKPEKDIAFLRVNIEPLISELASRIKKWIAKYKNFLHDHCRDRIDELTMFIKKLEDGLNSAEFDTDKEQDENDKNRLYAVMTHVRDHKLSDKLVIAMISPILAQTQLLKKLNVPIDENRLISLDQARPQWQEVTRVSYAVRERISGLQALEAINITKKLEAFKDRIEDFNKRFRSEGPLDSNWLAADAYKKIDELYNENMLFRKEGAKNNDLETLFDRHRSQYKILSNIEKDLRELKMLWDTSDIVNATFDSWRGSSFKSLTEIDLLIDRASKLQTQLKTELPASVRGWPLYKWLMDQTSNMKIVLPLVEKLKSPTMEDRHWKQLMALTTHFDYEAADFKLQNIFELELHKKSLEIEEICETAEKEAKNKIKISKVAQKWEKNVLNFELGVKEEYKDVPLLGVIANITDDLEADSQEVLNLKTQGKSIEFIQDEVDRWDRNLREIEKVLSVWQKVQKNWMRLEPIFMKSDDIRSQLPEDTAIFEDKVDNEFKKLMREVINTPKVVAACCAEGRLDGLNDMFRALESCEKSLNEYLEQKKKIFARFYFVSNQTLLTILSNGNKPIVISGHISNCFDGIKKWDFDFDKDKDGFHVKGMYSKENEYIDFGDRPFVIGKGEAVEVYLSRFEQHMKNSIKHELTMARNTTENWEISGEVSREEWLRDYCAQCALVASQIVWTEETQRAFDELDGGSESAMKDYKRVCDDRLYKLIEQVRLPLESLHKDGRNLRDKIITLITIDVHARDVIEKFVQIRLSDPSAFQWHSQLRFYWANPNKSSDGATAEGDDSEKDCIIKICDWHTSYMYEYIGNCGRLVITPLTDRCYITLTQALNLMLGGAPAGPAGTGKTETTKDLSRAIGLPVFVFNCSDQMDYNSTAQIFMGLAQTGAWGCFDEFNRISVEVLSVVASQVKSILDAIKEFYGQTNRDKSAKFMFTFSDEEISLNPTCGFFITMNPGYAGRSELPENLKALFRSCAMVVPDTMFICENMLMAEGFQCARELAHKFVTLYSLCRELLSKARHYDWGLRAVKAVLRQAGGLLRKAQSDKSAEFSEQIVLMKALRDFNMPKIVTPDQPIFIRLIQDLFPRLNPPVARDNNFEKIIATQTVKRKLQAVDEFVLKVAQLRDILVVRHCCFVLGPPGSAKSSVWRTLMDANRAIGEDGLYRELNPKAITTNELYGYQKDGWKDGVISTIMRNMSKEEEEFKPEHLHKWIILDGDIDAVWIESMNTVMDDNKVLTLVSNERIPFTPSMRLIFEIENMREASPATVSRGGVLFINEVDVGWRPYVDSWKAAFADELAASAFDSFFSQHFENNIESLRKDFKFIAPLWDIALVDSICHMSAAQVNHKPFLQPIASANADDRKIIYESMFAFAFMWTIGGAIAERKAFSSRFRSFFKNCKLPEFNESSCFDFKFDFKEGEWGWFHWKDYVKPYEHNPREMFVNVIVPTLETTRMHYVTDLHMRVNGPSKVEVKEFLRQTTDKFPGLLLPKPLLFVGEVGTGKTVLARNYLRQLDPHAMTSSTINLNYYTDSYSLQMVMESSLINLNQKTLAPPGQRQLIYFIDDLNMPEVDKYGTQVSLALLRQFIDYEKFFDRSDLSQQKAVVDCQFMACMNPKAGSFIINPQLQRHFTVLATAISLSGPDNQANNIFLPVINAHLQSFDKPISDLSERIIGFLSKVYSSVVVAFVPTATTFHYNFNLRDISNVLEGMLNSVGSLYRSGTGGVSKYQRLMIHELFRSFSDRMVTQLDKNSFTSISQKAFGEIFNDSNYTEVWAEANLFTSFVSVAGGNDKRYLCVKDMESLKAVLQIKLNEYNEQFAQMPLVLFGDAMEHVTRISRIIDTPAGNALLVGVGGSGKQSLSRLAVFSLGFDTHQFVVSAGFGMNELKAELQQVYIRSAVKPATPTCLIVTDQQIVSEKFLVCFNDFLSSGLVADLFPKEEFEGTLASLRNVARANGFADSTEGQLSYFIDKVRRNLHMIICHSPVGDTLRLRGRRFPALISCTVIDWFHAWPKDALIDVARSFLKDVEFDKNETADFVAQNMAEVHISIEVANQKYRELERRFNYTTPKSFLELISFYKSLLDKKRRLVKVDKDRLCNGLETLKETAATVADLKIQLDEDMKHVEDARRDANIAIEKTAIEAEKAREEKEKADVVAAETQKVADSAAATENIANEKYEAAIPKMQAAQNAVSGLRKDMIAELKKLGTVSDKVEATIQCVGLMLGWMKPKDKNDWAAIKRAVLEKKSSPAAFIDALSEFVRRPADNPEEESGAEKIDPILVTAAEKVIADKALKKEEVKASSIAAYNMADWLFNILDFWHIYQEVKPLKASSDTARAEKLRADGELQIVMAKVAEINEKVAQLKALEQELRERLAQLEAKAKASQEKLDLAERLVNGLASENKRWSETVATLEVANNTLIGDALLAACFVSYIGAFSSNFRRSLWEDQWLPDIHMRNIPYTVGVTPLRILADDKDMAVWKNQGLPADPISLENAAIVCSCARWPLMIDPQLQGVKWIRGRFADGEGFTALQLTQDKVMSKIENAMKNGSKLLIEAIPQELDASLDPLLSRAIVKNGKQFKINFNGNKDAEYHSDFRLFLQTKLPNPHYRPEIAAQCTIINFIVTPFGLEEQILAFVVDKEQPELELNKQQLVHKLNKFSMDLIDLENKLLDQLMAATSDKEKSILDNADVVLALEATKKTSVEIEQQVTASKVTEQQINQSREQFRPVAAEGSMLYFLLIELYLISPMYQFSLDAFNGFLAKAIEKAPSGSSVQERCGHLLTSIRMTIYTWISRGLFEKDKLIFLTMMTFKLLERGQLGEEKYDPVHINFLMRGPIATQPPKPDTLDWLPELNWLAVCELVKIPGFELFAQHLEKEAPARFKEWFNELCPEEAKLPLDWKRLDQKPLEKLLVLRCLRPDRMAAALTNYMREKLPNGDFYVDGDSGKNFNTILDESLIDATPTTPIFFILSPGADPVKEVESIGSRTSPKMMLGQNFHSVSMGQGQDTVALAKLQLAHKDGHWVMLQNIHLMPKFLPELEKKLDQFAAEGSHANFRCFLSSDPIPETNTEQQIPIGILQRCIKLTNEPPSGLRANLDRAFAFFSKDDFEDNDAKVKSILFGLCYFHAVMLERKKFGPMGWNMSYPFALGDLRDSATVLSNYMSTQNNSKVPWEDLRYIFGEIMYGGHIVDARDRLLCTTYLDLYMREELLDSVGLFPFSDLYMSPPPTTYDKYKEHITYLPPETPIAYGLHPNAEIGFRTAQCNNLFSTLMRLMPIKMSGGDGDGDSSGSAQTPSDIVKSSVRVFIGRVERERLDVETTSKSLRADDRGPYQYVFLQECEYMNIILEEIHRSLLELDLGLGGKLSMSDKMEKLSNEIYLGQVPGTWSNVAYPSTRPLVSWFDNLMLRFTQLQTWTQEPQTIPKVVKVNLLINPQSFLTAIKQVNSQQFGNELNKLTIVTEVTKRTDAKQIEGPAKEGAAYVTGFSLEGARWDVGNGILEESKPKEMFCPMPVVCCNAKLETDKVERNIYQCPVYKTPQRAATYVFTAQLRTKHAAAKWVLGGVAMILDTGTDAKDDS